MNSYQEDLRKNFPELHKYLQEDEFELDSDKQQKYLVDDETTITNPLKSKTNKTTNPNETSTTENHTTPTNKRNNIKHKPRKYYNTTRGHYYGVEDLPRMVATLQESDSETELHEQHDSDDDDFAEASVNPHKHLCKSMVGCGPAGQGA